MRSHYWLAVAAALVSGCGGSQKPAATTAANPSDDAARITQFYTMSGQVAKGEKALMCYGVENASSVWMEPPRQELSAALARCVEVFPEADTTYKLTAQGPDGKPVTRELKVAVGAPLAKLVNVNISALEVKAGEVVSVCYTVEHARAVTIDPIKFRGGSAAKGCITDQPRKSTTYTISALGAGGDKDQEQVTVRVK